MISEWKWITLQATTVIFPEHHVQPSLRPHHIDCNYTMTSRGVPTIPSKPNRNRVCSFDFCTPVYPMTHHYEYNRKSIKWHLCVLFTMWLHPPSFSMVTLHFGHSFVLAAIQFDVSESSSHFLIHFLRYLHKTGSCQFSPHSKQNMWPHLQATGRDST